MHQHNYHEINSRNIVISIVLNAVITIAEFIGGILSNSLALLSDAVHNLSDTTAMFISWLALRIGKKRSNPSKTFGYKRIEIIAAFINGSVLLVISFYLFWEAYKRFVEPEPIKENLMFIVATIGLLANLISMLLLRKDSGKNLNIKAAYWHLLGDTLSSVGVIIGSLLILWLEITWVDPLLTIIIGIMILRGTWQIVKEAFNILMEASPENLNIHEIKSRLETHPEIANIHHIHSWKVSDESVHFQCHADLKSNLSMQDADSIRRDLEAILLKEFEIDHVTIQMEYDSCHDKGAINNSRNC